MPSPFSPIDDILAELRAGRMVVLTDDEDRENEGDLILPAQFVSPEAIAFMLQNALGYLCLSLTEADCDRLHLHPQSPINTSKRGTPFTVSIDLHPKHGGTTGVSAKERARCIQMAIDHRFTPDDFVRPGHINPLRSRDGGVLVRTGQTEGSLDLCRLAALYPAAVLLEIMKPDGEMARLPDLIPFCERHHLKMCSVAQIIEHRLQRESLVRRLPPHEGWTLRTRQGDFTAFLYESVVDALPHLVLTTGGVGLTPPPRGRGLGGGFASAPSSPASSGGGGRVHEAGGGEAGGGESARTSGVVGITSDPDSPPTLVRMHRRHLMGDVFGDLDSSPDGPTGELLHAAMRAIQREGRGAIVYLRTQGDGQAADLEGQLQTPRIASAGTDPDAPRLRERAAAAAPAMPEALRAFGVGGQILRDLGLSRLRLLTNRAKALPALEAFGLEIVEHVPLSGAAST